MNKKKFEKDLKIVCDFVGLVVCDKENACEIFKRVVRRMTEEDRKVFEQGCARMMCAGILHDFLGVKDDVQPISLKEDK